MELAGKTAIVTGSGRGIGRALAIEFASHGANVVICARREADLAETAAIIKKNGGSVLSIPCDVTKRDQVDSLIARTLETFGTIDVLFNNAASYRAIGAVWEVDPDLWWTDVTTNFLGPMLFCRGVLQHMMKRDEGIIINMSGGGGVVPLTGGSGYGSSKAALIRFSETLAKELEREGSNVLVLMMGPGLVKTETTLLQTTDPKGLKWIPSTKETFDAGTERAPEDCARQTVELLRIASSEMNGRMFHTAMDLADVAKRKAEIKAKDLYVLRDVK